MKWSLRVATVAGIPIYVHATFVLIIAWVVLLHWQMGHSMAVALAGVWFVLLLFACVVLHELGHALTAQRYGIRTRDITLLPIGGLARLERMPDNPRHELWVALAGPAVNVGIAGVLLFWLGLTRSLVPLESLTITSGSLVQRLMIVNVFLVLFNLLPAFPMDGGRVLRALLAMRMDYARATQVAASVGQAMALLFGFVGLFINPFLVFIALFVWIGAAQEAAMVQMRTALGGIPVRDATLTRFETLSPTDPLSRAVERILAGSQQDFPVVEDGRVVGILTRADLFAALARQDQQSPVGGVMSRDFQTADPSEMLEVAFNRLQQCRCHTMPVMQAGKLLGLLTMDNVGEFLAIQTALKKHQTEAA